MERRTERNVRRIQAPHDCFHLGSRNLSVFQLTYKKRNDPPKVAFFATSFPVDGKMRGPGNEVAFFADVFLHKLLRLLGGEEAKNKTTELGG